MSKLKYWNLMRNEINNLHKKLLQKPASERMGYPLVAGGILNAYREGDVSFDDAIEQLKEWAFRFVEEGQQ